MTFAETFQIDAMAPFNFDLTAHIFGNGDKQIRKYANGQFSQVLKINDGLSLLKLVSVGTFERPKLAVELKSNRPITSKIVKKLKK